MSDEPATVAVLPAMRQRRLGWLRWNVPEWRTLERDAGFRAFEQSFLASPWPMIVVAPDFAGFDSRCRQTFAYLPLAAFTSARSGAAERQFLRRCIDTIRSGRAEPGEAAEILQIDGSFVADRRGGVGIAWTAPFDVVEASARVVSKRTCLDSIVPALRRGIGADEGGVYTPYAGEGIFHLLSM